MNAFVILSLIPISTQSMGATLFANDSGVVLLTEPMFDAIVSGSNYVWLIDFFQESCNTCVAFAPQFQKAALALKGTVKFGAINLSGPDEDHLIERFDIGNSVPDVKIFVPRNLPLVEYTGNWDAQEVIDEALRAVDSISRKWCCQLC